jgi:HEPN domain-containing protein
VRDVAIYRRDFRTLAELRAEEARVLLRSRRQLGAYYLAGYAVECALKACIAKQRKRFEFPPKRSIVERMYSHNLDSLLDAADLKAQLEKEIAANPDFAANWNTVKDWTSESRYETSGLNGKELYNAVTGPNGVLPWIRLRW